MQFKQIFTFLLTLLIAQFASAAVFPRNVDDLTVGQAKSLCHQNQVLNCCNHSGDTVNHGITVVGGDFLNCNNIGASLLSTVLGGSQGACQAEAACCSGATTQTGGPNVNTGCTAVAKLLQRRAVV